MKKLMISLLPIFLCLFSFSQDLVIKSGAKGLYLEHKVAPKQGLFPIGRLYNVHPRHIANFNGIDFNKGLAIGQQVNIPLSDTNFKQTVNSGIPVFYIASNKESLANISVKNKIQISNLRTWNELQSDNISAGTKLIVGFLITNEMQDKAVTITPKTAANEPSVSNVTKAEKQKKQMETEPKKEDVPKTEPSVSNVNKVEEQKKQMGTESKKENVPKTEPSVSNVNKVEEQKKQMGTEPKKEDVPKTEPSVSNVNKAEEQKRQMGTEPKKEDVPKTEPSVSNVNKAEEQKKQTGIEAKKEEYPKAEEKRTDDGTGYFKTNFYQQVKKSPLKKDQTLTSSIFKTTSGWQDGKYYLLINGVEPGTIVKITNPSNSKTVYAKVLYSMDKIRENQGVDIRISDAAASTLAISETDKFIVKVNY